MTDDKDRLLAENAKRLLDEAARGLDDATAARLRAARARAWRLADASAHGARPSRRRGWLPLGGLAVAGIVLAVAGTLWFAAPGGAPVTGFEDIELLASKDSPEFYSDIEFYHWLESRIDAT